MPFGFDAYGISDIGLSRPNNEDVWIALPEIGFFALADGMGGHLAGEIAAKEAIESLAASVATIPRTTPQEIAQNLRKAIEKANAWVLSMGRLHPPYSGMGTTLCCLYWTEDRVIYAHVGDSRIYRYRRQKLELLTEDHSLFAKWLATGKLAEECQTPYPYKNVITRAVGTGEKVNPEIVIARHEPDDLYFLCSDGLSDVLSLIEIEKILQNALDLESAAFLLIEKAKIKGSSDNMTILMIQKEGKDGEDLPRQQLYDRARPESLESHASGSLRPSREPL